MKEKKYLVLYYISFVITLAFSIYSTYKTRNLYSIGDDANIVSNLLGNVLVFINFVLVIIFTILILKKKKIKVDNIILPVCYILFSIIVVVLCLLFNDKVIIPYMHFEYYLFFINIGFLFVNSYSLFLINYKK
jgi:hypothetical protein